MFASLLYEPGWLLLWPLCVKTSKSRFKALKASGRLSWQNIRVTGSGLRSCSCLLLLSSCSLMNKYANIYCVKEDCDIMPWYHNPPMALTREHKYLSRIAQEIDIISIFAWLVPTLVPKHNSRFWVFCRTICWTWWSINIFETFGRKKIAVILRNLVSAPCSETGPNLRTSLFVDRWL